MYFMQTTIYLIRHGECAGNKEGLFRGRFDFPLNENGFMQAKSLTTELEDILFDAVYTSPLKRALQTAEALCRNRKIEATINEAFNNIFLGKWEGKPKNEIATLFPNEFRLWRTQPEKLKMEGTETLAEVQHRSVKELALLTKKHAGKHFALVTHRAVLKPLIAGILGISEPYFWKLHPETASYSIIEHSSERGFSLAMFNQTKHLKQFIREDL